VLVVPEREERSHQRRALAGRRELAGAVLDLRADLVGRHPWVAAHVEAHREQLGLAPREVVVHQGGVDAGLGRDAPQAGALVAVGAEGGAGRLHDLGLGVALAGPSPSSNHGTSKADAIDSRAQGTTCDRGHATMGFTGRRDRGTNSPLMN
jgi:hypothetical protein